MHSFYSSAAPSGENQVVGNEVAALRRAGHHVDVVEAHTDALEHEPLYRLRTALRVATGHGRNPLDAIATLQPDVVHVHNLFPNYGRRWVDDLDLPLVHTLHNYRPMCANGLLYRDGHVCTLCPDGHRLAGFRHACYRDSRLATAPVTLAGWGGAAADPLLRRADRLLVLSDLQRDVYAGAGVPASAMTVSPNFLPDELVPAPPGRGDDDGPFLGVGRLRGEKGFLELASDWPPGAELVLVGDGPQRQQLEALGSRGVRTLGRRTHDEVLAMMRHSRALVVPSRCLEALPLVVVEALAAGLPLVALAGNAVSDLVERLDVGVVLDWSSWRDEIMDVRFTVEDRRRARAAFERHYSERAWVAQRVALYEEVVQDRGAP